MGAITQAYIGDLEQNVRSIISDDYARLSRDTWWDKIAKVVPIKSKKERIYWLQETAMIERPNASHGGGQQIFEDLVSLSTEFEAENAVAALSLKKEQLEDLENGIPGGEGLRAAARWAASVAHHAAYWPQEQLAKAILANPIGYDGVSYFGEHPVNPYNTGAGLYKNVFTGSSSGAYPGALKIDNSVTVDVAVQNIAKAIAYTASIKMPNGRLPRKLKLKHIFVPPALTARAQQITNAKFIAQAAGSSAGSGDIEAVVRNFGLGQPIEVAEFGSGFDGGSDTSFYLGMEDMTSSELGAWAYVDREPFSVSYHGPLTDAELARKRVFEWTLEGRNAVAPGHPYLLFRCDAT